MWLVDDFGYYRACTCIWVFIVADLHAVYVCMKQQEKMGSFGSLITARGSVQTLESRNVWLWCLHVHIEFQLLFFWSLLFVWTFDSYQRIIILRIKAISTPCWCAKSFTGNRHVWSQYGTHTEHEGLAEGLGMRLTCLLQCRCTQE